MEFINQALLSSFADDVRSIADAGRLRQISENRAKLRPIVDTLMTCARQNIALRGHRDSGRIKVSEPESNDGNLQALLRMRVRAGDQILQKHLESSAANTQYGFPTIQNSLLDAAQQLIKESIKDVRSARIWTLMKWQIVTRRK